MTAEEYADACDKVIDVLKEKIANLEEENAKLKKKCYKKAVKDYCELEKQNKKLQEQIEGKENELKKERELNAEIKARFVKCNTCTDEMKSKCLMFSENLCEGERCNELIDLMSLIDKD